MSNRSQKCWALFSSDRTCRPASEFSLTSSPPLLEIRAEDLVWEVVCGLKFSAQSEHHSSGFFLAWHSSSDADCEEGQEGGCRWGTYAGEDP